MKKTILIVPFALLFACTNTTEDCTEPMMEDEYFDHQHDTGDHHGHHGDANEYMNQSSMEELVHRFESPERDAYQQPHKVLDYLGDIKGKKIIDIGAGTGYFSVKLANEGATVIAADVDQKFQDYLKDRIDKDHIQNIELRKIPYDDPALKEQEVDIVLIVNTYHHISEREQYFKKVKKGTKNNGELVIIDFFKAETPVGPPVDHKISIDEIVSELKSAGYSTFEVKADLLPYQYIIRAK